MATTIFMRWFPFPLVPAQGGSCHQNGAPGIPTASRCLTNKLRANFLNHGKIAEEACCNAEKVRLWSCRDPGACPKNDRILIEREKFYATKSII
jgi:hypothetical protein